MALCTIPLGLADAMAHIEKHHSHHHAPPGGRFAVGVGEVEDGAVRLACVAIVGRPVARLLDAVGTTAELTRSASDGTRHAASKCVAAATRAALALGYRRIVSYTILGESGTSYLAAGWHITGLTGNPSGSGEGWHSRPGRTVIQPSVKVRWETGPDALPADGAAALACAFAAWLELPVPERAETLPLLARMGDAA